MVHGEWGSEYYGAPWCIDFKLYKVRTGRNKSLGLWATSALNSAVFLIDRVNSAVNTR